MSETKSQITSFTKLFAWSEGHKLVIQIYQMTQTIPKEEIFGITNQMRRSAISITSNIAEGFSRQTYKEKTQFYSMALGSLTELQNQLLICRDVKYIDKLVFSSLALQSNTVRKLLCGLLRTTKTYIHEE